jgi:hypothetical protein
VQYSISLLRVVFLQFLDVATSLWIFLGQFGLKSKQRQAKLKQKKLINLGMCPGDVKAPDLKGKKLLKACERFPHFFTKLSNFYVIGRANWRVTNVL